MFLFSNSLIALLLPFHVPIITVHIEAVPADDQVEVVAEDEEATIWPAVSH